MRQSKADKEVYGTLDRKVKRRWLTALRSGKYKQARGRLVRPTKKGGVGYCCLGVLCDISKAGWWEDRGVKFYVVDDADSSSLVPGPYAKSIGLSIYAQDALVFKNDAAGWGFKRIANWIEKHL